MQWIAKNLATGEQLRQNAGSVLDYWAAGGWLMLPLAVVAFLILYSYLSMMRRLHAALATPNECVDQLERRLVNDPRGPGTREWLARMPGAVPRVARHLITRVAAGLPFHEAFQQCRDGELAAYSHSFFVLGALVMAAPLLGLLGTVLGMIETFDAVAMRSGQTAEMVAGGISQALITTQVGLVAALPGAFGLAHIYRLYQRLRNSIDRCQSHLYLVFERLDAPGASAGDGKR